MCQPVRNTLFALLSVAATTVVCGILAGCDRSGSGGRGSPDAELLGGTIEGNCYSLPPFGLRMTVPESWYMPRGKDLDAVRATLREGTPIGWRKRAGRLTLLAAAFEHPIGSTAAFNPGVQVFAEDTSNLSGDPAPDAYLSRFLDAVQNHSPEARCLSSGSYRIGSIDGATVAFDRTAGKDAVRQRYYAARWGQHMFVIVASSANELDDRRLQRIVSEISLGGDLAPYAPPPSEDAAGG